VVLIAVLRSLSGLILTPFVELLHFQIAMAGRPFHVHFGAGAEDGLYARQAPLGEMLQEELPSPFRLAECRVQTENLSLSLLIDTYCRQNRC